MARIGVHHRQYTQLLRRSLHRVNDKCPDSAEILSKDIDIQDILSLNLTRAVQLCVDLGSHLIAPTDLPPPTTMGQVFDTMLTAGFLKAELATRMKKAVGFRNMAVHNYEAVNWAIVYAISTQHLDDFKDFAQAVSNIALHNKPV